jgi:hypothetical protein
MDSIKDLIDGNLSFEAWCGSIHKDWKNKDLIETLRNQIGAFRGSIEKNLKFKGCWRVKIEDFHDQGPTCKKRITSRTKIDQNMSQFERNWKCSDQIENQGPIWKKHLNQRRQFEIF